MVLSADKTSHLTVEKAQMLDVLLESVIKNIHSSTLLFY